MYIDACLYARGKKIDCEENSKSIKALSDPNRLKIIDILSCGEKCTCEVLQHFYFTQPMLSHHMKVLIER